MPRRNRRLLEDDCKPKWINPYDQWEMLAIPTIESDGAISYETIRICKKCRKRLNRCACLTENRPRIPGEKTSQKPKAPLL